MTHDVPPRPRRRDVVAGLTATGAASMLQREAAAQSPVAAPAPVAEEAPAGTRPADGLPTVILDARPAVARIAPDHETEIWGYGGQAPGPVLRVRKGEELRLRLLNHLKAPTTIHWHGVRIANGMDGVGGLTQEPVPPGGTFDIRFTPPDAGTFLYRPLVVGSTAEQVEHGLAGMLVVEEASPPIVDEEFALVIDDWRLDASGAHEPFGVTAALAGPGRLGNTLTVNGVAAPFRRSLPPGARVRLRLANACNARLMAIRFDGLKAYVAAVDGQPTDTFEPLRSTLPFPPGARYDVLADLPLDAGATAGFSAVVGAGLPLLALTTEGPPILERRAALPPIAPLPPNAALPPAIPLQRAVRGDMVIGGGSRPGPDGSLIHAGTDPSRVWTVNGVVGDPKSGKPLVSVKRGATIVLALVNATAWPQVLHVHGHDVRLLHPLDDGWEPYWQDTVTVPEGRTLRIAFVADNPGRWLIGSTVLERLDAGLSAWFEVI